MYDNDDYFNNLMIILLLLTLSITYEWSLYGTTFITANFRR